MAYKDAGDPRNRAAKRKHYEANREKYIAQAKAQAEERRAYVQDIKASTACSDCGDKYPHYVMEFDHVGDDKVANVAELIKAGWPRLLAEIKKCELVCANCHRARTWHRAHM